MIFELGALIFFECTGVPNIYLNQKLLRKWTFEPGWRTDYLIGWNIMCVLIFPYAQFTFISNVLIFSLMLCLKHWYIVWRTPEIFSRRKEIFTTVFWFHCAILIYLFLSLLVLRKNYMRECFNHFYKIKIRESVKSHPRNLKKTKFVIYRFQKYAQNNLFSSFSTMLKPGFDYVLSTPLNHGLI